MAAILSMHARRGIVVALLLRHVSASCCVFVDVVTRVVASMMMNGAACRCFSTLFFFFFVDVIRLHLPFTSSLLLCDEGGDWRSAADLHTLLPHIKNGAGWRRVTADKRRRIYRRFWLAGLCCREQRYPAVCSYAVLRRCAVSLRAVSACFCVHAACCTMPVLIAVRHYLWL
jgi:hypothetical protein